MIDNWNILWFGRKLECVADTFLTYSVEYQTFSTLVKYNHLVWFEYTNFHTLINASLPTRVLYILAWGAMSADRDWVTTDLGWRLLSPIPPFRYFLKFSALSKHALGIEYHLYIWQVLPQLICDDTYQIWMWFEESNMYFCHMENFVYGQINERRFSNPHPWSFSIWRMIYFLWLSP